MKRHTLIVVLALAMAGLSGCIVIHTEKAVPCRPAPVGLEAAAIPESDDLSPGPGEQHGRPMGTAGSEPKA